MVWITSKTNGNVFEVEDSKLASDLVAEGHEVSDSDPRIPKAEKSNPDPEPKPQGLFRRRGQAK